MERVLLRAEYKTENIFSEGFICISKEGKDERIEGVFGLDYAKIQFTSENTFDLILYENLIDLKECGYSTSIRTTVFKSQNVYIPELTCPESYLLSSESSFMNLILIERENSDIDKIFKDLEKVRI